MSDLGWKTFSLYQAEVSAVENAEGAEGQGWLWRFSLRR